MAIDRDSLEYRKSAQAFVMSGDRILVTQEIQWKDNEWGFPGGQIENTETAEQTILRELAEEFPRNTFKILKQSQTPLVYDWPDELVEGDIKTKGWSFRGQMREQFLVELREPEIVEVIASEIKAYKWVLINELDKYLVFPNQLEKTRDALTELGVILE